VCRRSPCLAPGGGGHGERRPGERPAMARGAERADDDSAASGQDPAVGCISAPVVNIDFVARRSPLTLAGALLLLLGASAAAGTGLRAAPAGEQPAALPDARQS